MVSFSKRFGLSAGLIILLTLLSYSQVITTGEYIWDDDSYVTENPALKSFDGLKDIWTKPGATPQYYPLVFSVFWVEYHLWGYHPTGFHIVNILLHIINALLLWAVLNRLRIQAAFFVSLLFAVHPVHVESVAWVTELKNVLSGFFYLLSMLLYFKYSPPYPSAKSNSNKAVLFYTLSFICFFFALLSKTVTFSLPVAILLIFWWKKNRVICKDALSLLPFFILGTGMGLFTAWLEKKLVGAVGSEWQFSFWDRCLIAGRAIWFYATKLLYPDQMIFIYPRWEINSAVWWQSLFPIGVAGILFFLWKGRDKIGRGPLAASLFFIATLFPALGFFDVYPMRYSYVADHFQYLASIGILVLISSAIYHFIPLHWKNAPFALFFYCLIIFIFSAKTMIQGKSYQNEEVLWRDTIKKNNSAWLAHNNLGLILNEQDKPLEAIDHLNMALRFKPDYKLAHNNLGISYSKMGEFDKAIKHYKATIKIAPDYVNVYNNLANAYVKIKKFDSALHNYSEALRLRPDFELALINMGEVLKNLSRLTPPMRKVYIREEDYRKGINSYNRFVKRKKMPHINKP